MHRQPSNIGSSPLKFTTPTHKPSPRFEHNQNHKEDIHSPQSSTCVRSTSSQDPILTRSELINTMNAISAFALHYAAVYHDIGRSYHALPFSARRSGWVVTDMCSIVDLALNASHYKQLPDLVYIFSEISHRLDESQQLLWEHQGDWRTSEKLLRRCDALLQEAEVRLKFLQAGVWNMWFVVGRDEAVTFDEREDCARARVVCENRWLSVLPQICFADRGRGDKKLETQMAGESGGKESSWSG